MPSTHLQVPLSEARALVQVAPETLWPGFRPARIPLLTFDGETTHPSGAAPQEVGWTAQAGGWSWPGRHPALVANTAVTLPGGVVAAGVLADTLPPLDAPHLAALLVHEAFHVYQAAHPSPAWEADELAGLTYPRASLEVDLARAEESAHLALALARPEGWEVAARMALAWRRARFAHLSSGQVLYERRLETLEGLAHFVETRLLRELPRLQGVHDAGAGAREWAYRSGAALAHLLARGRDGWQVQVMAGEPLDELLTGRIGYGERLDPLPESLDAARRAAHDAERQLEAMLADFQNLPGPCLTLTAEVPRRVRGFDPLNVHALPDGRLLHRRYLRLAGPGGQLEVVGAAALMQGVDFFSVSSMEVAGLPLGLRASVQEGHWQVADEVLRADVRADAVTTAGTNGWRLRF